MTLSLMPSGAPRESELAEALQSGNEDRLIQALDKTADRSAPVQSAEVISILRNTASARVRAAAVVALVDLHATESVEALKEVLRRPEAPKSSGTLLFALNELGGSLPVDLVTAMLAEGSFESRAEALTFLEKGRIEPFDEEERAFALQRLAQLAANPDQELAQAAALGRAFLSDLAASFRPPS